MERGLYHGDDQGPPHQAGDWRRGSCAGWRSAGIDAGLSSDAEGREERLGGFGSLVRWREGFTTGYTGLHGGKRRFVRVQFYESYKKDGYTTASGTPLTACLDR